ncbi:MAG: carboxylating nicotinate-nucleotide diphosphorylase, partial [Solirubrobacterales bacterium]
MEDPEALIALVAAALAEDVGAGDVTAQAVVPQGARGQARITQKAPGVVYGFDVAGEVMRQCGVEDFDALVGEGEWRDEPTEVASAAGTAASLLAAERT